MRRKSFLTIVCLAIVTIASSQTMPKQPTVRQPLFRKDTVNIVSFGAKGDGLFLNTIAINKAVSVIAARKGGVVVVPAGLWISGPIVLKSNVNLHR
ncbi:MAG: hypothetical protein H7Y31_12870 [Chitinophagaceae bacterium]|nr:hypothetical protein [Chitinophagaceae bacterium]